MRAYYASKVSEHISKTPDGYLICKDVPIARTGVQEYLGEELGLEEHQYQSIEVYRAAEDVFDPAALASFEGKPVTDGHPDENVTAENVGIYLKGIAREIRRGSGEDSDKVLADLIIYDKALADEIEGGKREISCGYECAYEKGEDGRLYQRKIRGNHVAVVPAGRAGSQVRIKDSTPQKPERRKSRMAKKDTTRKSGVFSALFPLLAKDADPGEVQAALEVIEEAVDSELPADEAPIPTTPVDTDPEPAKDDEIPPWAQSLMEQIAKLQAQLTNSKDEDPLDELENELKAGEASVSKPAEQIDEDGAEYQDEEPAQDIDPTEDEGCDPTPSNDSLLQFVRTIKPVIAGMKDVKAKKKVTDSLVSVMRGIKRNPGRDGYAAVIDAQLANARAYTADKGFDLDQQQALYDNLNPHKKK